MSNLYGLVQALVIDIIQMIFLLKAAAFKVQIFMFEILLCRLDFAADPFDRIARAGARCGA